LRILFDTNVILDVLLDREPFSADAIRLLSKVESNTITGYISATTLTTIYYLTCKIIGAERAREETRKLLSIFQIAPVNQAVLEAALNSGISDFEDAVLHEAAIHIDAQSIVSRNISDFRDAKLPVYLPEELLSMLSLLANNS
jgi:predicted nucleic acid-binding protein